MSEALKPGANKAPFKVAVAGLGTVGAETVKILLRMGDEIAARVGRQVAVTAVSARDRTRDRGFGTTNLAWYDDPVAMARNADVDLVCELIGGSEGVAKAVVEASIASGRHVVTANKALLAHHGTELAEQAEAKGIGLAYEASVAGGIPIIKALREGLAGNRISGVYGILNGTCNYILSVMRETGRDFADVLADAQRLGYAEADPSFDVDGIDAAHKLSILTSLAFGSRIDFSKVHIEGIRHITALDIEFAEELGYRIKLLGIARETSRGIEQRVHPCMVKADAPIATVENVYNAVVVEGDSVGRVVFEGRGAGSGPTASAVVGDILDLAAGRSPFPFGLPCRSLKPLVSSPMEAHRGAYYVRLMVVDRSGVFADIAAALRDAGVSMEAVLQRGRAPGETVPVVMTLHETAEVDLNEAIRRILTIGAVVEAPRVIRIEPL